MILDKIVAEISQWLEIERTLGTESPTHVVLSTVDSNGIPHSRIVAVREISPKGVLFFTHRKSRKAREIENSPHVSMTFWFAQQQREVVIEGQVITLTSDENQHYWESIPRERQIKFFASYPISGEVIQSAECLDEQFEIISNRFSGVNVPMHKDYCGFICQPTMVYFYTLGEGRSFSTVIRYTLLNESWQKELLAP